MSMRHAGNALSEYGLIIALAAVAVIAALFLLGGNMSTLLSGVGNTLNSTSRQAIATGAGSVTVTGATGRPIRQGATADSVSLSFVTADGNTIGLEGVPADLRQAVATSGANGTTEILASQLSALADQLLAAGEVSPAQANILKQLSNQGHRMAAIEKLIEDAAASYQGPQNQFSYVKLTYEGQTMNVDDWGNRLAWAGEGYSLRSGLDPLGSRKGAGAEMQTLQAYYEQAAQSGALNDPAVRSLVSRMSAQIADVAEGLEETINDVYFGRVQQTRFQDAQAAQVTNSKSRTICTAGQGSDSGIQCR